MTTADAHIRPTRRPKLGGVWSIGALLIALIVVAPVASVLYMAFFPSENIWPHLMSTVLPRYLRTTLILMAAVGLFSAMVGTGAAWLMSRYRFIGSSWLEWALLLPLGIPAYVGAYALVDFLEYAGPVQSALREVMGWKTARDYWFPEIRSLGAAILVLTAALYPYVYLLARAAFRDQSGTGEEVAQSLGNGPLRRFWRVGLPLARPAIAAGVAIVMMETVNDFGTVNFFAVQTLTTGIFNVWLESNNAGGAAQLASVILALVIILVTLEKFSRRRAQYFSMAKRHRSVNRTQLRGLASLAAFVLSFIPFFLGFVLPVAVLLSHAMDSRDYWLDPKLLQALGNTILVGGSAAVITVLAGLFMVYGVRLSRARLPRLLLPITTIGYAAPGAVLGVGILIPLAALDNSLADLIQSVTGYDIGLIMTGTAAALVLAYSVRFFAIAQGAADAALGRVPPNLANAARSLGRDNTQTLIQVYFPLIRGSVASALLLVFVDCVKELPATLLLRPFNFETLATRLHQQASLENLSHAAPSAILITGVGMLAVLLLSRTNR